MALRAVDGERGSYFEDLSQVDIAAEREWFAEGALGPDPLVVLTGAEKSGKSWAIADLVVATALGTSWLGAFPMRRPGNVVVLDAEYGPHEYARRLARITRAHGQEPAKALKRVCYRHARDLTFERDEKGEVSQPLVELSKAVKRLDVALVVIDPFRNFLGGDENSAVDTIATMRLIAAFRDRLGCPVAIAHHLNKAGTMSGSRAISGRADVLITGTDGATPTYTTVGRTFRRGDPITRPFVIEIDHEDDSDDTIARTFVRLRFEGDRHARRVLGDLALRILDILKANFAESMSASRIRSMCGRSGRDVNAALVELEAAGRAERKGRSWTVSHRDFEDAFRNGNGGGA